ncbi:MAG: type III-A CRISPR-associated protein Csm2 [Thermodesulfobacteriota bacterium]|nr:type III-A CRISPR-associated protein Csm2 [Thermodesulfobacteriota bacterium]
MATITLWKDPDEKILDPFLFSQIADDWAVKISKEGQRERDKNKSTQLRRFFDEIIRLNTQAQAQDADWNIIFPHVHMVVAKAAYAKGRNLVTDSFVSLMRDGISQVNTKEDLRVFTNFFESFMGFYKMHRPR